MIDFNASVTSIFSMKLSLNLLAIGFNSNDILKGFTNLFFIALYFFQSVEKNDIFRDFTYLLFIALYLFQAIGKSIICKFLSTLIFADCALMRVKRQLYVFWIDPFQLSIRKKLRIKLFIRRKF